MSECVYMCIMCRFYISASHRAGLSRNNSNLRTVCLTKTWLNFFLKKLFPKETVRE